MTDPDGEWVLTPDDVATLGDQHRAVQDTRGRVMCGSAGCREWPCVTVRLVRYWWDREIGD